MSEKINSESSEGKGEAEGTFGLRTDETFFPGFISREEADEQKKKKGGVVVTLQAQK